MNEYRSQEELFKGLIPAMNVKLKLFKNTSYHYITKEDIWNYLKEIKWKSSSNLTLGEMVNDIIKLEPNDIDKYLKEQMKNEKKKIII